MRKPVSCPDIGSLRTARVAVVGRQVHEESGEAGGESPPSGSARSASLLLGGAFLGLAYAAATSTRVAIPELRWSGTSERSERIEAAAIEVIDGDTFEYRGEKIRIADIDTPEVRGRCPYETALAARATDRMGELLAAGPFELKAVGRDEDRYGRKLRIVIRDGRSLGDQLVAEGLARTWTGRREPWCA